MNPVFEINDLWYFWDESWTDYFGPYSTEQEAEKKMREYIIQFLGQ